METFGLAISLTALLIAVYGIIERQRAAYAAVKMRLTELLGSLEAAKIEEYKYTDEHADPTKADWAREGFASRRALLTYQALNLTQRLDKAARLPFGSLFGPTLSEYGSLAYALQWCGDLNESERYWIKSLDTRGFVSSYVLAANHRGYASLLFAKGRPEQARSHYEEAIRSAGGEADAQRWDVLRTYIAWIEDEKSLFESDRGGSPDAVVDRARAYAASDAYWGPMMQIEISGAAHTAIFADGKYQEKWYGSAA